MKTTDILALKEKALQDINSARSVDNLESVRIRYLGRKGLLPEIMKSLKLVNASERAELGKCANQFKNELNALLNVKQVDFQGSGKKIKREAFDYTLPGRWCGIGTRHPITQVIEQAIHIFDTLGFAIANGPDIETEFYNFDALNTPANHPSRDTQSTFWLETGELLRTQTSPVQIRVMEKQKPPVRIIAPGRCYRRDTVDATHSANFYQIEGLYIDKNVSMADLKGDIAYFAKRMMAPDVKVRFRPHFFPFTEPSVEYDFSCHLCGGKGCRLCKNSGWIEISGAGMVSPKVLKCVGYDPETVTGYAFGMGVERIAMIKYGINDIRLLYDNDIRFLEQLSE